MWAIVCAFVAGCGSVLLLPQLPAWPVVCALAGIAAIAALACRSPVLAAVTLGACWCWWQGSARLAERLDPALEGRNVSATGTVVSVPQGGLARLRFRFAPDAAAHLPPLLELSWYDARWRPQAGERLTLELRLRRPRGFANPGGSDNDARMLREGIGASGYVRGGTRHGRDWGDVLRHPVLVARGRVADCIRATLGTRPAAGIVAGLSVGLQDALSREQWLALARSGTSHLMAISGLHIAMVAAIAAWCGGRLQRWRQGRGATGAQHDAAVLAGAIAAGIYSLLAGWSVPTQRTMVMIALAAIALRLRRNVGTADGFALCAAAVVVMDPLALLAPGFWLSFGAVAAIVFATSGYLRRQGFLRGYLHVQGAVTLGLTPVLVGSFGNLSLVSAVVNLLAIPLYTLLIVPAVLVATVVVLVAPGPGGPLMRAVAWLIEATWPLIAVPASWPAATWAVPGLDPVAWLALVAGVVAALAPLPWHGRLAGVLLVVLACAWRPSPLEPGAFRLVVLDVGQGLASVVQTRGHVLVFDTGPSFRSGSDAGMLVVAPYLKSAGIRQVDLLVVSHDDDDHKGGTASVLGSVPARQIVAGPGVRSLTGAGTRFDIATRCRRGLGWEWDGVRFDWPHPGPGPYVTDNDGSCVLLVQAAGHRVLLTGDIETTAEAELLNAQHMLPVDVVVAPHHGSRTSSSAAFVAATAPRWIVYTVGHRNRWGFPSRGVAERWRAVGAQSVTTSSGGACEFLARPGRPLAPPRLWRLQHHRFWQDP